MAELTRLGRYKLGKVLGRGAMGVVYEGLDPSLNRRVAIKTILKNAAIDAETAQMYSAQFAREAQAAGRLNHPNIVQVHDFAEEDQVAYLVMEYIQGRELRSFFEAKEKFEPAEAVRIMGELLDALDFAHEAGVIHRDIKPANVMLDAQRRVKLADFGVARIQDSERSAAGTMVGTPAFMSPEQISGGKIDRRTDLFSAGVVLYQLLTGEQPFKGEGAWTVAKKIMQDDPPLPSVVVKSVSPGFDDVVNKALAKNPAQRFASAKEFAAALRGVLAGAQTTLPPGTAARPKGVAAPKATEAEVEFWRAIQNSTDAAEFEFYLEQFPDGTYAQLARHKISKLSEPAAAARRESEDTVRLEAEARARREAEEQARREADERAAREAEEQARRAAAEKARLEAEAWARREAEEKARREAEARAEARAKRAAAEKAAAEKAAAEKARLEAEAKVRRAAVEAEAKARREAEEKARQAAALAKLKQQQQEAAARARVAVDEDATVAIGSARPAATPPAPPPAQKKSFAVPAIAAAVVIVGGIAAYLLLGRTPTPTPAPVPVAAPAAPAAPAVDAEKIRRETEERLRKEFADKAAVERAALEKSLVEKLAAEKAAAEKMAKAKTGAEKAEAEKAMQKAAAERAAADKAAADKAAQTKAATDKAAAESAAAERAAAEKAAAEKAAADRAAAEKAAAQKEAADKAAAEKAAAAAAKPGWPGVGDRWTYEASDSAHPDRKYTATVEVREVTPSSVRDVFRGAGAGESDGVYRSAAVLTGTAPGILQFAPYLRAFQEIHAGDGWSKVEIARVPYCVQVVSCEAKARVVGQERVTVRAGSFDAWKIEVELRWNAGIGSTGRPVAGTVKFNYWYSEQQRRFVKYQARTVGISSTGGGWSQPDMDMELVSYVPGTGTSAAAERIAPEKASTEKAAAKAEPCFVASCTNTGGARNNNR